MDQELRKVTQLRWRSFLATEEGKEGIAFLRNNLPEVARGEQHHIVLDAGVVKGYNDCLKKIFEIIGVKEDKEVDFDNR